MKGAIRVLLVGAAAGYLAGQVMDQATTWFYGRQSDASKQRENELLPEGAPLAAARKLAGLIGAEPTDEQAGSSPRPCTSRSGRATGSPRPPSPAPGCRRWRPGSPPGWPGSCWSTRLANSLFFTPPPQAYPVESHLRGAVGHLAFGATLGALLAVARRLRLL